MSSPCRRPTSTRGGRIRCGPSSPRPPASTSTATSGPRRSRLPRVGSVPRRVAQDFLAMVVSTTVEGGIVLNGQLLEGATGNAGSIGHIDRRAERSPLRVRLARLPRCRGVGPGHRGDHRPLAVGADLRDHAAHRATRRRRRWPRCATCLDIDLAVVGGSVALGFGATFFNSAQETLDEHAQLSFSRRRPHHPGPPRRPRPVDRRRRSRFGLAAGMSPSSCGSVPSRRTDTPSRRSR